MTKRIFQSGGGGKKGYGGFPVSEFIALTDAPHAYTGAAAKFVTVKAGENGLEFTPLPPLAITDTFVVNSQAEMLALVAQTGDVAIRTDINQSFILSGTGDPTILANWYMLLVSPTHAIGGALHTADTLAHLKSKLSAPDTLISSDAGEIAAFTEKTPAIAADLLVIEDSADGNKKKKIQIGNLPAAAPAAHAIGGALHTADTLAHLKSKVASPDILITSDPAEISTITNKAAPSSADLILIEDSADTNKKKSITIGTLPTAALIAHADRHAPAVGSDPLLCAIAGTSLPGDTASQGTNNTLSRSDHVHAREPWWTRVSTQRPIGQTYIDLIVPAGALYLTLIYNLQQLGAAGNFRFRINNDAGNFYTNNGTTGWNGGSWFACANNDHGALQTIAETVDQNYGIMGQLEIAKVPGYTGRYLCNGRASYEYSTFGQQNRYAVWATTYYGASGQAATIRVYTTAGTFSGQIDLFALMV